MKTTEQILAEIERQILTHQDYSRYIRDSEKFEHILRKSLLENLKEFILSESENKECEHVYPKENWVFDGPVFFNCPKCKKDIQMEKLYP